MGRRPIGKKAMTPAQRQRRRRVKIKRKLVALGTGIDKAERRKRRLAKIGKQIVPAPPGITYWRQMTVSTPGGDQQVWVPITAPAAGVMLHQLTNGEIEGLIAVLQNEQDRREGTRPMIGELEKAAFKIMQAGRPGDYLAHLEMFAREPRAAWDI